MKTLVVIVLPAGLAETVAPATFSPLADAIVPLRMTSSAAAGYSVTANMTSEDAMMAECLADERGRALMMFSSG